MIHHRVVVSIKGVKGSFSSGVYVHYWKAFNAASQMAKALGLRKKPGALVWAARKNGKWSMSKPFVILYRMGEPS